MQVLTLYGNFLFGTDSRGWKYDPERGYFQECDFSGTVCLSDEDVDAIVALRKVPEECVAACDAYERRRFLNETARDLFIAMAKTADWASFLDPKVTSVRDFTAGIAKIAAEAAGDLFFEVEKVAATYRNSGLDVS